MREDNLTQEGDFLLGPRDKSEECNTSDWKKNWFSVDGKFAGHAAIVGTFMRNLTSATSVICTQV